MNDILVDKFDNSFKANVSNFNMGVILTGIGSVFFYLTESVVYLSLFSVIFSAVIVTYSYFIKTALSYFIYVFLVVIYFIAIAMFYQIYYLYFYSNSLEFFIYFYVFVFSLVFLDYRALYRNGVFLRLDKGFEKTIYHVEDIFGEKNHYIKVSLINQNRVKVKMSDGSMLYTVLLLPLSVVLFFVAPFVKSIPVIFGNFVSKSDATNDLIIIFFLSLLFNFIILKFICLVYSGVAFFKKKKT
ncbi:hypothetical protein EC844_114104 [Acinetobacter calcoaceticus]|uniref:Uncharacterized protein n=1 Tax=Acinetobacter calcoaceticus TaxID=471 RepID=A0A4V2R0T5_ACICA|nr:hypothetical protein EC844_114104 [Acinetobacter calcoaceticus]